MERKTPTHYQNLKAFHPEYVSAVENFKMLTNNAEPLDESLGQFIQLAAAIAIKSEGATHSHTRQLVEIGFSAEEIRHALLILTSRLGSQMQ